MEFGVLGPLRVRVRGAWAQVAGAKQRAVLGILLINANRVVPSDQLLEEVWGDRQPTAGIRTLRYHVSKLRDALDPDRPRGRGSPLQTESGGYLLTVGEGDLDAQRFERLAADGARAFAAERFPEARSRFHEALALWRGDAFDDFRYESFAQGEIARLEEERLACLENRIATDLALGHHRDVVAELRELTTRYPYRKACGGT
jgi:DNA-binding SARP family transcriptional activator